MEKSWTITLSDGTKLKNLGLNGTNFISEEEITEDVFKNNLSNVIIEGTNENRQEVKEKHEYMDLIHIQKHDKEYYFALRDLSQDEIDKIKMQADIDYIAMMSDVDLEEN